MKSKIERVDKEFSDILDKWNKESNIPKISLSRILAQKIKTKQINIELNDIFSTTGKKKMKRKGFILDMLTIIISLFVFAVIIIIGLKFLSSMNDNIQAQDTFSNDTKTMLQNSTDIYRPIWDGLFMLIFIGLWAFAIISTIFLDIHPIFLFLGWLLTYAFIVIGLILANVFNTIMADSSLSSTANQYIYITFLFNHFILFMLFISFTLLISLYARSRRNEG